MLFDGTTRCVPSLLSHRGFAQLSGRSIYEICRVEVVLRCIRDILRGRKGPVPMRSVVVRDEEGNPSELLRSNSSGEEWRRHFTKVLNIQNKIDLAKLKNARQRPLRSQTDDPPLREELEKAISKMKSRKAGIVLEVVMIASCDEESLDALLELVGEVWKG